jgi:hypothetical protein
MNRREFLKGLLSFATGAALVRNGIVQPEKILATPERTVFDMAANTWRKQLEIPDRLLGYPIQWTDDVSFIDSPIMLAPLPSGDITIRGTYQMESDNYERLRDFFETVSNGEDEVMVRWQPAKGETVYTAKAQTVHVSFARSEIVWQSGPLNPDWSKSPFVLLDKKARG